MQLLDIVKYLESTSSEERFAVITQVLSAWQIPFVVQQYSSGKNIIVNPGNGKPFISVSSHFDVVPGSFGANDNASAMAVCLGLLKELTAYSFSNFGVCVFFFDEEETGLKGSKAYVKEYGVNTMKGLINMEMVGQGDKFALWPVDEKRKGIILETFEKAAKEQQVFTGRFDKIVTNSADHVSFLQAGVKDVFTISCIGDKDIMVAREFYAAQEKGRPINVLQDIIAKAPLFKHYHQPTDVVQHLNETSLQMTLQTIWKTLLMLDELYQAG